MTYPFHYHDCTTYCGPASIMMILDYFGAQVSDISQQVLYDENHHAAIDQGLCCSTPDALVNCLNRVTLTDAYLSGINYSLKWRPCEESPSPARPFYEMMVGPDLLYADLRSRGISNLTHSRNGLSYNNLTKNQNYD